MSTKSNSKILLKPNKKIIHLDKYTGKWVAFIDGKIVGVGKSLPDLIKNVKKKRISRKPSVLLVPRKDEGPYILFL